MSETKTLSETTVDAAEQSTDDGLKKSSKNKADFTQKLTKIILSLALLYFVWYLISDRITPMTDQARVRAFVTPIVPEVAGHISKIHVGGDRVVKKGDLLFEIDPRDYEFAVKKAEGDLELAGQDVGANTASVVAAKANLAKAQSDLVATSANANRIIEVSEKGLVSKSEGDRARGNLAAAQQNVVKAEASYQQAKETLGKLGEDNAKVQNALSVLANAQLDLARTKVYAPSDGVISYAKVDVGFYAAVGTKIMTFISTESVWIEASYRENNLGNIKADNPVDFVLDSKPGEVFSGSIVSVGYGVSFDKSKPGDLPTPQESLGWMREPQRFVVIIKLDDEIYGRKLLREGGQVDVITYTSDNFIMNALGKFWIKLTSILSYIY